MNCARFAFLLIRRRTACGVLLSAVLAIFLLPWKGFSAETQNSGVESPAIQTLYVSKLGDNSDGGTWDTAYHTIQSALSSVPNDQGGHEIVVRPDTYVEANLAPKHKSAAAPTTC